MAFRGGNRNRNFGGNYGGGQMGGGNRNMNPWDNQSVGNYGGGNMRQGGGGGPGPMNAEALSLANNLLNNLLRNQNPPSLLDLPRGGGGAGGMGGPRGPRGQMGNRAVGGGGNRNNRRTQGGFARGGQKQGSINKQGGGIRKQNAFDRAKKLLAKNSNKKKDSTSGDNTEISKKESIKESPYADVPNDMFYCHLCKKHMWDANSFENHIKGRTHLMMREGIEESYRLKANMIRQEAKIAEQLKTIELDRLKRMGKSGKNRNLEYCTMCDLNFHGHLSAHRKSDGHLQLKKFLHPKCNECNKEFPTRIEFDTHLLSSEHLKKCAEKNTKVGERKKNTLQILTEEDELKDVRPPQKKKKKTPVVEKKEGEEGEKWEGVEIKKENGEEEIDAESKKDETMDDSIADETKEGADLDEIKEEDEPAELPVDPEDCILDFNDGDEIPSEVDAKLPKYNWTRPVGSTLISRLECYECSICGKFFDTDKTAEIHSRTASHHRQFLKFINDKSSDTKIAQKRAAAAIEETERKRKRLEEAEAAKEAENNGEEKTTGDLYDPSQATGEDEDVEMNQAEGQQANGNEKTDDMNGDGFKDAGDDEEEEEEEEEEDDEDYGTAAGGTADEQKMDVQEVVQPEPVKEEPVEIKPVVVETPVVTKQSPVITPAPAAQPIPQQQPQHQQQQQQPPQQQQPQQQLQQQQQQPQQHQQQHQQQQQQQQTQVPQSPVIAANSPQKKQTPARGAGAKGKPGSRGRGRYNRY